MLKLLPKWNENTRKYIYCQLLKLKTTYILYICSLKADYVALMIQMCYLLGMVLVEASKDPELVIQTTLKYVEIDEWRRRPTVHGLYQVSGMC